MMNIYTFKLTRKTALAALLIVAALIVLIILLVPDKERSGAQTAATGQVRTEADCIAYIQSLGYVVSETPVSSRQVTIPETFDDVYAQYNALQQTCGFDLTDYKGKRVTLRTFSVTNYPNETDVMLDLLICKSQVIGGAVYTAAIDGFMHGLKPLNS